MKCVAPKVSNKWASTVTYISKTKLQATATVKIYYILSLIIMLRNLLFILPYRLYKVIFPAFVRSDILFPAFSHPTYYSFLLSSSLT